MESVDTYELKGNLSKLLDRVESGETITITRNGKSVAVLVPPPRSKAAAAAVGVSLLAAT